MAGRIRTTTFVIACLVSWIVCPLAGLSAEETPIGEIRGKTMGTTYLVKFRLTDSPSPSSDELKEAIDKRLVEINQSMSTYIGDSEISRFNQWDSVEPFTVTQDFVTVASTAIEIHNKTDGVFDVTVGPLVRFWGFGGGTTPTKLPATEQVESVLKRVGSDNLNIDGTTVSKKIRNLEVDFSAIAKGYAVDEVCQLVGKYADDFMVEIGGEVRTRGENPASGKPWAIGIEMPQEDLLGSSRKLAARVELGNQALATSGDYRNFVMIEGKRFQHTIDPKTGFPVDRGILSVSILADDCMYADGLATGMMVLPLEQIKSICQRHKIAAFVLFRNEQGETDWWKSDLFTGEVMLGREQEGGSSSSVNLARKEANPIFLIVGTVVVFGLAISGMAIGVIMSNRQLKGSCGGLSAMNANGSADASPCSLCTKPASECKRRSGELSPEELPEAKTAE